jgi:hypothetical protein
MATVFVCLANSLKEGGKCIAGIELDEFYNPVIVEGQPKWIRPVCPTTHGEVPEWIAAPFDLLDILSVDGIVTKPEGYQCENVLFDQRCIHAIGKFPCSRLSELCHASDFIFGNQGKAISEEAIVGLDHSLMFICVEEFAPVKLVNINRRNKPQIRMHFRYQGVDYDFPVTDPFFRYAFEENPKLLEEKKEIYLCVSIGIAWEGWHYKLVAGVFY